MVDEAGVVTIPTNKKYKGEAEAYTAYYTQDPAYIASFNGTSHAKIFELEFYKTFTAPFETQLSKEQQLQGQTY